LRECEARLAETQNVVTAPVDRETLLTFAADLNVAWNASMTDMRTKQRLVRALVEEIVVDVDEAAQEVVLVIHWRGGKHSEVRARKASRGHHERRASPEVDRVIREMATRWSDAAIATTLNRIGMTTGQGNTWNAKRVASRRREAAIAGPASGMLCLTMIEAAERLGVSRHVVKRLIDGGVLPATQVTPEAPWQIHARDLDLPAIATALGARRKRRGRPRRGDGDDQSLLLPGT